MLRAANWARDSSTAVIVSAPTSFLRAISSASFRSPSATMHSSDRPPLRPRLNSPRNFHPATTAPICDADHGFFQPRIKQQSSEPCGGPGKASADRPAHDSPQNPDSRAGFLESCRGYRAATLKQGGRQLICPHSAHTSAFAETSKMQVMPDFVGERGGTRTLDPMIKSHVLYHLSYALTCRAV
jgi:hypothetical protein